MAMRNNQFVSSLLSRRCNSRKTSVFVGAWRVIGRGTLYLLFILGFCGVLIVAKPASMQRDNYAVTTVAATNLKADFKIGSKHSPSNELRDDRFKFQPVTSIGAIVRDSEEKSASVSKGFQDIESSENVFTFEQDKPDVAEDLKPRPDNDSEVSENHKVGGNGVEIQNELLMSAASDLKPEHSTAGHNKKIPALDENLVESAPANFDETTASDRKLKSEWTADASPDLHAVEDAFPLRMRSLLEVEMETGSRTGKEKLLNVGGKEKGFGGQYSQSERENIPSVVYRRIPNKEMNLVHHEDLVRIGQGSASTQRQGLQHLKRESGSENHPPVKNDRQVNITTPVKTDRQVNITTADGKYDDTRTSKRKSNISAHAGPSFESDQVSADNFDDVAVHLQALEPEEADEKAQQKNLIPEYSLGEPVSNWDRERQQWLEDHPEVKPNTDDGRQRLFMLTGTQPYRCLNEGADHLLLRCFKNKVDYCRIRGIEIFYNMALLHPNMPTFWAKLPVVRATMLSHPEVEWIWWLDADAIITDMEFEIPLERYEDYNMVVFGWESLVFEKKSWVSLNAGSFLIRNCQWSMDLLERWASMGPQAPLGEAYRDILSDELPDRPRDPTDDQAAFVFLLNAEKPRWAGKVKVELDYFLNGYFVEMIDGFEAWEKKYREMEKEEEELMEMVKRGEVGKEKLMTKWGRAREKRVGKWGLRERRPFITHFTGCQPCNGHKNPAYTKEQCHDGLVRALNYGDDQVLRPLGFRHRALLLPDLLPSTP